MKVDEGEGEFEFKLVVKDKEGLFASAVKSVQILAEDDFPPRYFGFEFWRLFQFNYYFLIIRSYEQVGTRNRRCSKKHPDQHLGLLI